MQTDQNNVTETDSLDKLPHLPALESIEIKGWDYLCFTLGLTVFALAFAVAIAQFTVKHWQYLGVFSYVIAGFLAVLSFYLIIGSLTAEAYFRTDEQGLMTRSLARRKFIAWDDVIDATAKSTKSGNVVFRLKTKDCVITIPNKLIGIDTTKLVASIAQHLSEHGKTKGFKLPFSSLSLWDRIPDEVPSSMDISTSTRQSDKTAIVIQAILFGGMLIFYVWMIISSMLSRDFPIAVMFLIFELLLFAVFGRTLRKDIFPQTVEISIREDYFKIKDRKRKVTVQWSDVAQAEWDRSGILIRTSTPKTSVLIPVNGYDEKNSKLALAVIRRLRTAGVPQALDIPCMLRANWCAGTIDNACRKSVELRLSRFERIVVTGLIPLFGVIAVPKSALKPQLYVPLAVVLLAAWWIASRMAGLSAMVVDEEGVTRQSIRQKSTVKWEEVVSVSVKNQKLLLMGVDDKVLMNIVSSSGTKLDEQDFYTCIFAKLAAILPPEAIAEPWKARSWSLEEAN